jgi:acetoin utilization protein AcuB
VSPDDEIADVAQLLHDRKLNGVLVVNDKGDLVGILTTTNALEALIGFATAYRSASR